MRSDASRWTTVAAGLTRLYIAFGFGLWALVAFFLHGKAPNELQRDALGVASPLLTGIATVLLVYGALLCTRAPSGTWLRPLAIGAVMLGSIWGVVTILRFLPFAEEWQIECAYASLSFALAVVLLVFLLQMIRQTSTAESPGRRHILLQWWLAVTLSIAVLALWIVGRHAGFTKLWRYALAATGAGGVFLFSLLAMSVRRLVVENQGATMKRPQ